MMCMKSDEVICLLTQRMMTSGVRMKEKAFKGKKTKKQSNISQDMRGTKPWKAHNRLWKKRRSHPFKKKI